MKILLTTDLYKPSINGVVTSVLTLRSTLLKQGHEVRILTLGRHSQYDEEDMVYYVTSLDAKRIYPGARVTLTVNRWIFKDILSWGPDIVHSQCEFSTMHAAKLVSRALEIPIVHTYHTVYEDYTHYIPFAKYSGHYLVRQLSKQLLRDVSYIIAPTEKVHKLLIGYKVKPPIAVIPTGLTLEKFQTRLSDGEKAHFKARFGIPNDAFLLVFVGRLAKEKKLQEVLQFMRQAPVGPIHLLVVGDGPYRESLEQLAQRYHLTETTHFIGKVEPKQVAPYYQLGDCFVSSSTSETQGLTYIEAMASGLPLLCRYDPCLEGVLRHGQNGYAFSKQGEFNDYLRQLIENPKNRQRMQKIARRTAESQFSAECFGKEISGLYKLAIRENRALNDKDLA